MSVISSNFVLGVLRNADDGNHNQHVQGNDSGEFLHLSLLVRGVLQDRNPCLFKAAPNGKIPVCEGKRQQIAEETERAKVAKVEVGKKRKMLRNVEKLLTIVKVLVGRC